MEMGFRPSVRSLSLSLFLSIHSPLLRLLREPPLTHPLASQFLSNSLCRYPKYQVPGAGSECFYIFATRIAIRSFIM